MNDVVADFFENTRALSQRQLDWLVQQGVPPLALARDPGEIGYVVGAGEVEIDGELFDFTEKNDAGASSALIFVARDSLGKPYDLIAWMPKTGKLAAMLGRGALLGEQTFYGPRLSGPAPVHRSVLDWLRADRDGAVIVRPKAAARALLASPGRIAVADEKHALEIKPLLLATVDLSRLVAPIGEAA